MNYLKVLILWSFFLNLAIQCAENIQYVSTLEEHKNILTKALQEAKQEIVIVSPYISINAVNRDNTPYLIEEAQKKGVRVTVYTDFDFDVGKPYAEAGRKLLRCLLCDLHIVRKIHAKVLIVDNKWIVTGSFNWLSAVRDGSSDFSRLEHSIFVEGGPAQGFIDKALSSIKSLNEYNDHPYKKFYDIYIGDFFSLQSSKDLSVWYSGHEKYLDSSFEEQVDVSNTMLKANKQKLCSRCKEVCDNSDTECSYCHAKFDSEETGESSSSSSSSDNPSNREDLRELLYNQIERLYQNNFG